MGVAGLLPDGGVVGQVEGVEVQDQGGRVHHDALRGGKLLDRLPRCLAPRQHSQGPVAVDLQG